MIEVGMLRDRAGYWSLDLLVKKLKCQAKDLGHGYVDKMNDQLLLCWKKYPDIQTIVLKGYLSLQCAKN